MSQNCEDQIDKKNSSNPVDLYILTYNALLLKNTCYFCMVKSHYKKSTQIKKKILGWPKFICKVPNSQLNLLSIIAPEIGHLEKLCFLLNFNAFAHTYQIMICILSFSIFYVAPIETEIQILIYFWNVIIFMCVGMHNSSFF